MTITSIKLCNFKVEQLEAENAALREQLKQSEINFALEHDDVLELRKQLAAAQKDAERLNAIRELCGYVQDGSSETVRICQDDATREWIISVGGIPSKRWYHGSCLRAAIDAAIAQEKK